MELQKVYPLRGLDAMLATDLGPSAAEEGPVAEAMRATAQAVRGFARCAKPGYAIGVRLSVEENGFMELAIGTLTQQEAAETELRFASAEPSPVTLDNLEAAIDRLDAFLLEEFPDATRDAGGYIKPASSESIVDLAIHLLRRPQAPPAEKPKAKPAPKKKRPR